MFYFFNLIFLLILFTINIVHFNTFDNIKREKDITEFVKLSQAPGVIQSVGFYEDRFKLNEDGSNIYYLKVPSISYSKFAYE